MEKTISFTNEELKAMKSVLRIELEEELRSLNSLGFKTPANCERVKYLKNKIETLNTILNKINQ